MEEIEVNLRTREQTIVSTTSQDQIFLMINKKFKFNDIQDSIMIPKPA